MHFSKDDGLLRDLTVDSINELLQPIVGSSEVQSFNVFDTGWENVVIAASSDDGKFVVRISTMTKDSPYAGIAAPMLEREVRFVEAARALGVPVAEFRRSRDDDAFYVIERDDRRHYVAVMAFVDGVPSSAELSRVADIATTQAQLHQVQLVDAERWGIPLVDSGYSVFAHRVEALRAASHRSDLGKLPRELARIHNPIIDQLTEDFCSAPKQMIHADLTPANVLVDKSEVIAAIIDFNDCRLGTIHEDIGTFLWAACESVEDVAACVSAFVDAYQTQAALSTKDVATSLRYAIDRYLTINRHYFTVHPVGSDALIAQQEQAERQLITVRALQSLI